MSDNNLGGFLKTIANMDWDEFVRAEKSKDYTTNESIVFALVRACAMQKLDAIKLSLNRLDGKLKTPIKIEYPKVFMLYPNAKGSEDARMMPTTVQKPVETVENPEPVSGDVLPPKSTDPKEADHNIEDLSLRETLRAMAGYNRQLPEAIIALQEETEMFVRNQGPRPREIPRVKSVVAAHLLVMAQKRNMEAIYEVFDQIDGKLVETLQILGEDIYLISYSTEAPPGAYLNDDGVLQIEAEVAQQMWTEKLAQGGKP